MANCKSCGKSVGCGCQLTNGLCIDCINKKNNQIEPIKVEFVETIEKPLSNNVVHINLN